MILILVKTTLIILTIITGHVCYQSQSSIDRVTKRALFDNRKVNILEYKYNVFTFKISLVLFITVLTITVMALTL